MNKAALRRHLLQRLEAMAPQEFPRRSALIAKALQATPQWQEAQRIGIYAPLPLEVDLVSTSGGDERLCFPRVEGERLVFHQLAAAALVSSRWKIPEPPETAPGRVALAQLDLLIVPGLGFCADGRRLGRGGGFYDRTMADPQLRARRFGVCYAGQLLDDLPLEPHDLRVERVFFA